MSIDDIILVGKYKLTKPSNHIYSGMINNHQVQVKAKYTIGKRFCKDIIPNGYSLTIDGNEYKSDKKLLLRDVDNILKALKS